MGQPEDKISKNPSAKEPVRKEPEQPKVMVHFTPGDDKEAKTASVDVRHGELGGVYETKDFPKELPEDEARMLFASGMFSAEARPIAQNKPVGSPAGEKSALASKEGAGGK